MPPLDMSLARNPAQGYQGYLPNMDRMGSVLPSLVGGRGFDFPLETPYGSDYTQSPDWGFSDTMLGQNQWGLRSDPNQQPGMSGLMQMLGPLLSQMQQPMSGMMGRGLGAQAAQMVPQQPQPMAAPQGGGGGFGFPSDSSILQYIMQLTGAR